MSTIKRVSSFSSSKILGNPIFSQVSQAQGGGSQSQQDDGKQTSMYFVIPVGKSEENCGSSNLAEMFQACQAHFLTVRWIKEEECTELGLHGDGNIFVFDPFGGTSFKYWEQKMGEEPRRIEILGPQVLRYVFTSPDMLTFQTKGVPTYTLAMRDIVITLSGFKNTEQKAEMENLVRYMNGTVTPTFTKAVTHVVTVNASTKKCIEAHKQGIPVMTEEWIKAVWKDNQSKAVDAKDARYIKYACPVFYNVQVCMSQISAGRKVALKAGIERLGGFCSPELIRGKTDILVVMNPGGEKFKFAQRWKVPCVVPEWVENSTDNSRLLPYDDYIVSPDQVISTPAHSHVPDLDFTRCSAIMEHSKLIINATSELSNVNVADRTHEFDEALSKLKGTKGAYLDGCTIYVVESEKSGDLKRALNTSGAVRLNRLDDGVTHVIVTGQTLPRSVQERLKELDPSPCLVTVQWLLKSASEGNPVEEEPYKFEPQDANCQRSFIHAGAGFPAGNIIQETVQSSRTDGHTTRGSKSSSSSSSSSSKTDKDTSAEQNNENNTSYNPTINNPEDDTSPGLLIGIKFKVALADEEECRYVEDIIVDNSGTLTEENVDVVILPPVCDPVKKEESDKSYTKYWLFECLENNSLDIPSCFHHIPLAAFKKMNGVMKNVVTAISQYPLPEREYTTELIKAMGGRCQEVFAKKDAKDLKNLRSTHLICKNMDTDKAKAAKRWEVPVVLAEWVVESFLGQKKLGEEKYNPEQQNTSDFTVFMPTPKRPTASKNNVKQSSNTSLRSVYPPSNRKAPPIGIVQKTNSTPERDIGKEKNPVEPKGSTTASKPVNSHENDNHINPGVFLTPPSAQKKNPGPSGVITTKATGKATVDVNNDSEEDSFLKTLPKCPSQDEIDRKIAELKALDPYSDESFQRFMDDLKARGINIDDHSPFTSMEDARLCNPDPDSPLLLGLPRHESRAIKEQYEVALQLTPIVNKIKLKPPTSTPMSEIVRKFNDMMAARANDWTMDSSPWSLHGSPRTSTPKNGTQQMRVVAAKNRLSQSSTSVASTYDITDVREGIKKLPAKRPSDGSPESDSETKSTKRQRTSTEGESEDADLDVLTRAQKSTSPNENIIQNMQVKDVQAKPSTSRRNKMQALTNLIAENQANQSDSDGSVSPTKRRSGGDLAKNLVPPNVEDEVCEAIEQPHLSWAEDNEPQTVKKLPSKPVVIPEPQESPEKETRKRSSRLKKTSSVTSVNGKGRTTRSRSQSKSRNGEAPMGHELIQVPDTRGKKSKKSQPITFPITLPDHPVFTMSSLNDKDKAKAASIITQLGGKVSKLQCFDPDCVGLITETLIRSEKILGCIASGKYILKLEYLRRCEKEGYFLPISEEFLWHENNINHEKERDIAKASHSWLLAQMKDKNNRPMSGMKFCILDQPKDRLEAFTRLVIASGGQVVDNQNEATCIIKDEKSNCAVTVKGIPVKNVMYLNTLILSDPVS